MLKARWLRSRHDRGRVTQPEAYLVSLSRSDVVRVLVEGCRLGFLAVLQQRHRACRKLSLKLLDMNPYTMGLTQLWVKRSGGKALQDWRRLAHRCGAARTLTC